MVAVRVIISTANIHGTNTKTILLECEYVGHHAFFQVITKVLMSGSLDKFLGGYFSGADGSDKVFASSPVTLNHKSNVLEEIHVSFTTANTSDLFTNEKCNFNVLEFQN